MIKHQFPTDRQQRRQTGHRRRRTVKQQTLLSCAFGAHHRSTSVSLHRRWGFMHTCIESSIVLSLAYKRLFKRIALGCLARRPKSVCWICSFTSATTKIGSKFDEISSIGFHPIARLGIKTVETGHKLYTRCCWLMLTMTIIVASSFFDFEVATRRRPQAYRFSFVRAPNCSPAHCVCSAVCLQQVPEK